VTGAGAPIKEKKTGWRPAVSGVGRGGVGWVDNERHGGMDGWMDTRSHGGMEGGMDGWMDGWGTSTMVDGWMDGHQESWRDGWMDGHQESWRDGGMGDINYGGWMNGWTPDMME